MNPAEADVKDAGESHTVSRCPACGDERLGRLYASRWGDVVVCRGCELTRLLPQVEPSYQEIYGEGYFTANYLPIRHLQQQTATDILTRVERLVPPGRLVDYGCGLGVFLDVAHHRGWSCIGFDISPVALHMARSQLPDEVRLHLLTGDMPVPPEEGGIRCVTFLDSLAHIPTMPEVLDQVLGWINLQGVVVIRTPIYPRRLRLLRWVAGRLSSTAGDLIFHVPQQLWHFTPKPLTALLQRKGFKVISMSFTQDYGSRRRLPLPGPHPRSVMRWSLTLLQRRLVPRGSMLAIAQRQ